MGIVKHSLIAVLISVTTLSGCVTLPGTNKKAFIMTSVAEENKMGEEAYRQILATEKRSNDARINAMLKRVGERIAKQVPVEFQWEFTLIESKEMNAFCLPGGRVAVYTGILPITQDETGLAVVLSHEVAHALARHGAERMSTQMAASSLEQLAVGAGYIKSEAQLQVVQAVYGVGAALPHSRAQESEADHIGLILMAKAGYDPRQAVPFWQRMSGASGGKAPPVFLSTHPSDTQRIERIQSQLPEALTYYKQ